MSRPLIVMALPSESAGLIESLGFEIVYTGIGKVNAAYALTKALMQRPDCSYVLNLGSAGSRTFARGALVEADRFAQRDMDVTGLGFALGVTPFETETPILSVAPRFAHLPRGLCATGDSFLQGPSPIACDLADMEAYALAKVCALEGVSFTCVKYVTDGADAAAPADWNKHLTDAPHAFAALLRQHILTKTAGA